MHSVSACDTLSCGDGIASAGRGGAVCIALLLVTRLLSCDDGSAASGRGGTACIALLLVTHLIMMVAVLLLGAAGLHYGSIVEHVFVTMQWVERVCVFAVCASALIKMVWLGAIWSRWPTRCMNLLRATPKLRAAYCDKGGAQSWPSGRGLAF